VQTDISARIYRPSIGENKPQRSFSVIENERFGQVFPKTGSINSGTQLSMGVSVQQQFVLPLDLLWISFRY